MPRISHLLCLVVALVAHAAIAANECNPTTGCNVCAACCDGTIPDGVLCDFCVKKVCKAPPAPPPGPNPNVCNGTIGNIITQNTSDDEQRCNVCDACCNATIPDGPDCNSCVGNKCSGFRVWMKILILALTPFVLRFLQSIVTEAASKWVGGKIAGCCCAGKNPLDYALMSADEDDDKGHMAKLAREYPGWKGWTQLYKDRGFNYCLAVSLSLIRLFFWHLMQPVVYGFLLYIYWLDIDDAQRVLAAIIAAREGTYILAILYMVVYVPATLLVNLNQKNAWVPKMLYVLAPEKFLLTVFREFGFISTNIYGFSQFSRFVRHMRFVMFVLMLLDGFGIAALVVGAVNNMLPAALAVGYAAVALAGVLTGGILISTQIHI